MRCRYSSIAIGWINRQRVSFLLFDDKWVSAITNLSSMMIPAFRSENNSKLLFLIVIFIFTLLFLLLFIRVLNRLYKFDLFWCFFCNVYIKRRILILGIGR